MSLIEGTGFSLPIATITERVDVNIEVTPAARLAVKSAIGDVLQQKIVVGLENKKKDFAKTLLNKQSTDPKGPESQEEITDGSRDTSTT